MVDWKDPPIQPILIWNNGTTLFFALLKGSWSGSKFASNKKDPTQKDLDLWDLDQSCSLDLTGGSRSEKRIVYHVWRHDGSPNWNVISTLKLPALIFSQVSFIHIFPTDFEAKWEEGKVSVPGYEFGRETSDAERPLWRPRREEEVDSTDGRGRRRDREASRDAGRAGEDERTKLSDGGRMATDIFWRAFERRMHKDKGALQNVSMHLKGPGQSPVLLA